MWSTSFSRTMSYADRFKQRVQNLTTSNSLLWERPYSYNMDQGTQLIDDWLFKIEIT